MATWNPARRSETGDLIRLLPCVVSLLVTLSCLVFLVFASSGFAYRFLGDPNYRAAWFGWLEATRAESSLHPISIRTVWPWLAFFLATSPLVLITLPLAVVREWRQRMRLDLRAALDMLNRNPSRDESVRHQ